MVDLGMPDRVRQWALDRGAHNDCLVAGPEACCFDCYAKIMAGFDAYYGASVSPSTLMAAIMADLSKERHGSEDSA